MKQFRGLKKLLVDFLKGHGDWVHSGALEQRHWLNPKTGVRYKPSTASRMLRELAEHAPGEQPILLVRHEPTAEYCFNTGLVPKKIKPKFEFVNGVLTAVYKKDDL